MRRVGARARAGGGGGGGALSSGCAEEEWPREGGRVVAGWGDPLCFSQGRGPPRAHKARAVAGLRRPCM